MNLFWATVLLIVGNVRGISVDPLVYWSMDEYDGTKMLPDIGDEEKYSCDLAALGDDYAQPGVKGDALYLKKNKIKLIQRIWRSDCIRNPVNCKDGLTLAFWLNVEEFTSRRNQVIMRSTTSYRSRPGVFIGGHDKDQNSVLFFVRTAEGKQYQASISRNLVLDRWTHVAMTWRNSTGIQVSINGTLLSHDEYTAPPTIEDVSRSYPTRVDFVLGDIQGPIFLIDEFWIFYHDISSEEIMSLYGENFFEAALFDPTISSTPNTSTTSTTTTTEQTPPPRSTTAIVSTSPSETIKTTMQQVLSRNETIYVTSQATTPTLSYKSNNTIGPILETTKNGIVNGTTVSLIYSNGTFSFINSTESNATITAIVTVKTTTTTIKPWITNTYDGWFYSSPWFYAVIIGTFLLLLAVSMWLCITHCIIPACEKEKCELKQPFTGVDEQAMEPLV